MFQGFPLSTGCLQFTKMEGECPAPFYLMSMSTSVDSFLLHKGLKLQCLDRSYKEGFKFALLGPLLLSTWVKIDIIRGAGASPAGTAATGPMLEAKLMNLIKGQLQKF